VAAIMLGGAIGALARAGAADALSPDRGEWPWATLLANLTGTILLAWLVELIALDGVWGRLLGTGFCGALTTFSTFQIETIQLARDSGVGSAAGYAAVSLAAGMALAATPAAVMRR
jgi:CrcB protein